MSNAHKGSRLILKDQVIAVDFNTAHFDYNVDATGIQYGNIIEPLNGSVYTMRPHEGRFGGGVAIEQGTTNLVTNGNFSNGLTGWTIYNSGVNGTVSVIDFDDKKVLYLDKVMYYNNSKYPARIMTLKASTTYTVSLYVYMLSGTLNFDPNGPWNTGYGISTPTGQWVRHEKTFVTDATGGSETFHMYSTSPTVPVSCYIADFQVEEKVFPTSFVEGTRVNGWMSYPKELINLSSFTINMWVNFSTFLTATYQPLLEVCSSSHQLNRILLMYREDVLQTWVSNSSSEITNVITSAKSLVGDINSWAMVTFSFDGSSYKLYINGVLRSTTSSTLKSTPTGTLNIGGRYWGSLNGKICDVAILRRSATQEEIWSWYVSNIGLHNPHDSRSYAF